MTKHFLIILVALLWCNVGYSEDINQRLDYIDKRLKKIEESLKGLNFFNNWFNVDLSNSNIDDLFNPEKSITKVNPDKIDLTVTKLDCSKVHHIEELNIAYFLDNNYEKDIKLIKAKVVVKDLFGDTLTTVKLSKKAYIKSKDEKFFKDKMQDVFSQSCSRLKDSNFEDYVFELHVEKIAFEDNSILDILDMDISGLTLSEEDALKAQIFGCWSIPLGLPYDENLLVRVKLKLKPDGTVIKAVILDSDRMNMPGQGFYTVLAESVLRAIQLCQPLKVPTSGYERWKDLQLNFDAREMLGG